MRHRPAINSADLSCRTGGAHSLRAIAAAPLAACRLLGPGEWALLATDGDLPAPGDLRNTVTELAASADRPDHFAVSVREIARHTGIEPAGVTAALDALEGDGYVEVDRLMSVGDPVWEVRQVNGAARRAVGQCQPRRASWRVLLTGLPLPLTGRPTPAGRMFCGNSPRCSAAQAARSPWTWPRGL